MTWDAVDSATSYELWVNDGEQRTVQFIESNITATNFTPTTELNLGRTRAWVRANFANGRPLVHQVPHVHQNLIKMAIGGEHPITVMDFNIVSIAATAACKGHFTMKRAARAMPASVTRAT